MADNENIKSILSNLWAKQSSMIFYVLNTSETNTNECDNVKINDKKLVFFPFEIYGYRQKMKTVFFVVCRQTLLVIMINYDFVSGVSRVN